MVVPCVLHLYKHVRDSITELKDLFGAARVLRNSLISRSQGIFARVNMASSLNLETAPFCSKVYFIAAMLDPNYQLYWVEDLVAVEGDQEIGLRAGIKAKLKGLLPI
jgi:hypothetical protein